MRHHGGIDAAADAHHIALRAMRLPLLLQVNRLQQGRQLRSNSRRLGHLLLQLRNISICMA